MASPVEYVVVAHGLGTMCRVFGPLTESAADALCADLNKRYPGYYSEVRPRWDAADADRALSSMPPRY